MKKGGEGKHIRKYIFVYCIFEKRVGSRSKSSTGSMALCCRFGGLKWKSSPSLFQALGFWRTLSLWITHDIHTNRPITVRQAWKAGMSVLTLVTILFLVPNWTLYHLSVKPKLIAVRLEVVSLPYHEQGAVWPPFELQRGRHISQRGSQHRRASCIPVGNVKYWLGHEEKDASKLCKWHVVLNAGQAWIKAGPGASLSREKWDERGD